MGLWERMRRLSDELLGAGDSSADPDTTPSTSRDSAEQSANSAARTSFTVSPCERTLTQTLARQANEGKTSVRYALLFSGDVQGVGFRWTNQGFANEHHLSGWARNLDDGTVEMKLQGPPAAISEHLARVHAYYRRFHNRIWLEWADELPIDAEARGFSVRY